jgi:DNA-nicking Smr family endonuclease
MSARRKGPRGLSPEDTDLWSRAMRDAKPLSNRPPRPVLPDAPVPKREPGSFRPRNDQTPPKGPLGIDGSLEKRLRRGAVEVDATLDLHGETQARAHDRLTRFLNVAEATGRRAILVVTGKGAPCNEGDLNAGWETAQARGVLRRMVPQWLKEPPLHDKVLAVRPAHQRHGGSGALYVILRRARKP